MTSSRGATISTTGIVSCHEYSSMIASVAEICRTAQIHSIPPSSVNSDNVSTSAVTRATNTPRRSRDCVAIDSWWMCSNPRTRSAISASSEARTSRRAAVRPATNASRDQRERRAAEPEDELRAEPALEPVVEDLLHQDRNDEVADDGAERDDDREDETPAQLRAEPEPGDQDAPRAARCSGIGSSSRSGASTGASSITVALIARPARTRGSSRRSRAGTPSAARASRSPATGRPPGTARGRRAGSWTGGTRRRSAWSRAPAEGRPGSPPRSSGPRRSWRRPGSARGAAGPARGRAPRAAARRRRACARARRARCRSRSGARG